MFADHDVKPGRLRIALVRALKPRSELVVRAGRTANLPLFSVATSGTWSLAGVTVATHVLLAALLSRPSPPRQGQAAGGRCTSLDTTATARGMGAIKEDGEDQDAVTGVGRTTVRRAIGRPLTSVTSGLSMVIRGHAAPQVRPCDRLGLYRFPS